MQKVFSNSGISRETNLHFFQELPNSQGPVQENDSPSTCAIHPNAAPDTRCLTTTQLDLISMRLVDIMDVFKRQVFISFYSSFALAINNVSNVSHQGGLHQFLKNTPLVRANVKVRYSIGTN
jgi:hypothetical protein